MAKYNLLNMKKMLCGLLISGSLVMSACGSASVSVQMINPGVLSEELIGLDYKDVETSLKDQGFSNIHSEALEDLFGIDVDDEGKVRTVLINGDSDFSETDQFPADASIVILYHSVTSRTVEMIPETETEETEVETEEATEEETETETESEEEEPAFDFKLADVPAYDGKPYIELNKNVPMFDDMEITTVPFEIYSDLDEEGRCGVAFANICKDLMPREDRGEIGAIKPSGWQTTNYHDLIDGNYLYNRCHLIAFQLAGENANEKNLITGTRYLNTEGMQPFEDKVADYVNSTGNHVLYRVTPVYEKDDLVASGVEMEARSVEDDGKGLQFLPIKLLHLHRSLNRNPNRKELYTPIF